MDCTPSTTIIHLKMRDEEDMDNWLAQAQKYLNSSNNHRQAHRDSISVGHRNTKLHCVSQTSIPQYTPGRHKHSYSADSVDPIVTSNGSFSSDSNHKKSSSLLPKRIKFPSMSSFRSFSSSSSNSSASTNSSSPLDSFDQDLVHRLPLGEYIDDDELSLIDIDFEPITPKSDPSQQHGRSRSLSKVFQSMTNLKSK